MSFEDASRFDRPRMSRQDADPGGSLVALRARLQAYSMRQTRRLSIQIVIYAWS
jgi:hypothetical protein